MHRVSKRTRSQRGCQRCKTKRTKCDEAKPACQSCLKADVICQYTPQLKWSRKHEKFTRSFTPQCTAESGDIKEASPDASRSPRQDGLTTADSTDVYDDNLHDSSASWQDQFPYELDGSNWFSLDNETTDHFSPALWNDFAAPLPDLATNNPTSLFAGASRTTSLLRPALPTPDSHVTPLHHKTSAHEIGSDTVAGQASTPSSGSLLGAFYRLAYPTPTAHFSDEHLIKHYFTDVCCLYSCFDSSLNPFRSLVGELLPTSNTISLSIQSMAISHLSNHYLYMAPLGHVKLFQSWKSLQMDLQLHRIGKLSLEKVLISLLLLGLSSTWHQPTNLGLQYLYIARNLIQTHLRGPRTGQPVPSLKYEGFFFDALLHWEMLASFVDPVPMMTFPGYGATFPKMDDYRVPRSPHPWTGVSPEMHYALAEVGRLIRRRRRRKLSPTDSDEQIDESWAISLEEFLHTIRIPKTDDICDYSDHYTPKVDLVSCAVAYQYMGLLEIYSAFPQNLADKLMNSSPFPASDEGSFQVPQISSGFHSPADSCLGALSLHILNLVRKMRISSAACRFQPLILVSCASQLRLPGQQSPMTDMPNERQEQIVEARYAIEAQMLALSRKYPQKKLLQMLDIIKETWQRLDDGDGSAHWLDVAHEEGLQTMMG